MKISREVLQTIVNYQHVASKDETRIFLNTVKIDSSIKDQLTITATDGSCLISCELPVTSTKRDALLDQSLLFIDDIKRLDMLLKNKEYKDINIFNLIITEDEFILGLNVQDDPLLKCMLLLRDYPKTEGLCPKESTDNNGIKEVNFNPDILQQLNKTVYGTRKTRGRKKFKFFFTEKSEYGPTKIIADHKGIYHVMLIMPLRD